MNLDVTSALTAVNEATTPWCSGKKMVASTEFRPIELLSSTTPAKIRQRWKLIISVMIRRSVLVGILVRTDLASSVSI